MEDGAVSVRRLVVEAPRWKSASSYGDGCPTEMATFAVLGVLFEISWGSETGPFAVILPKIPGRGEAGGVDVCGFVAP